MGQQLETERRARCDSLNRRKGGATILDEKIKGRIPSLVSESVHGMLATQSLDTGSFASKTSVAKKISKLISLFMHDQTNVVGVMSKPRGSSPRSWGHRCCGRTNVAKYIRQREKRANYSGKRAYLQRHFFALECRQVHSHGLLLFDRFQPCLPGKSITSCPGCG